LISNSRGQGDSLFSQQSGNGIGWGAVVTVALLGVFLSASAHAAVFTVNIPSDGLDANPGNGVCEILPGNGICTLRAAIQETNALAGDDSAILPPNTYRLTIDFSPLVNTLIINGNLDITGGGASTTIIQGGSLEPGRVLNINAGFAVNLSGVTIRGAGLASSGIGNSGTLTVTDSTVSFNSGSGIFNSGTATLINSTVSGNSPGGGIFNSGTATLTDSTVSGNLARTSGPNMDGFGGGIYNSGILTLTNGTVSANGAFLDGGGIYNDGAANLFNATITNNQADANFEGLGTGGGIFNSNNGTFNFQNTILAGNFETVGIPAGPPITTLFAPTPGECDGTINSIGSNLMTMADCTVSGSAPIIGNPNLGPLQNNGGPTQTHALLSGSPAIAAGNPGGCRDEFGALLATDQRGFPRPADGNKDSAAACDIGAYELSRVGAEFGEVLTAAPGQASVLAAGIESSGTSRGPAFQLFNAAGTLQTTQFALNPDFGFDVNFVVGNFDGDAAQEILVGGQETTGLARGPAYQIFDPDGTLKLTRFVLNPDFIDVSFSPLNLGSNGVLACGQEISGLSRGPAYQVFDSSGNLVGTQFVLNPDFRVNTSCVGANLDGIAGDEVIVGGREVTGLARGPAFQLFGSDGSLRLTQFVLNPNFTDTKLTVVNLASNGIIVSGQETSGGNRGPAFQTFDSNGNFILTRFALNPNFTDFQVFGANTTNGVTGEEIVTGGTETGGLARGPAIQVWDRSGNHLFARFVLNPDFTEVKFTKIDINNDGVDEILVVGSETKGLQRGPAFQLFDGSGNLLVTQFVLNPDFTNLKVFTVDQNGDGDKELGIGGTETSGLMRGPAYQIFESNGTLLQTRFVLNPDF